ncbi:SH3 domain-containing protein [Sporobolomyces koalae]|uniref:SH3 domain-containing protein n=1 Tax=Sporobolomyces koalae TaxID=500713 RepID=UPI00317590A4
MSGGRSGGAFSQAKAYAEKGRTHVNSGFAKVDNQWQQRQRSSSSASAGTADRDQDSTAARTGPPPPPASRTRAPSSSISTPTASGGGGVFTNLSSADKQAFFALLDEYFSSRPQFSALFTQTTATEIENLSSFPRRGPLPTSSSSPAPPLPPPSSSAAPPPPPPTVPAPATRGLGQVTALYDYVSSNPEDLNFAENETFTLLEIVSDDWWKGETRDGKQGIFPANYVQRS